MSTITSRSALYSGGLTFTREKGVVHLIVHFFCLPNKLHVVNETCFRHVLGVLIAVALRINPNEPVQTHCQYAQIKTRAFDKSRHGAPPDRNFRCSAQWSYVTWTTTGRRIVKTKQSKRCQTVRDKVLASDVKPMTSYS